MTRGEQTQIGVWVAPELLARLEKHRERLDKLRPEGAELTSRGTAIRNLMIESLDAAEAREATGR